VAGSSVARNSYATLHATARLNIAMDLDWGQAIVRPFMTLSDGTLSARFNLGAYYPTTPTRSVGTTPRVHEVEGYDILHGLYSPVGETYAVDAGVSYLIAISEILTTLGFTALIDQHAAGTVLPTARVWPIDENIRWLTVVNDLLAALGYAGIWSDWNGRLRCSRYISPQDRSAEWTYDTGILTSQILPGRTVEEDFFEAPNRWVTVRSNNVDGSAPVEGDGIYTFTNESQGKTSREARGGKIFTKPTFVEVADQAALVAIAQQIIDTDLHLKTGLKVPTTPNPLHWHFDRLHVDDPAIGPPFEAMCTQWTLPLLGGMMSQEWTVLG